MNQAEKPEFYRDLAGLMASYSKPLPERAILDAWWANLQAFPLQAVRMAFSAYQNENGEFAPTPAGIAMRCRLMDGRPGAEEAWALALTSRDEADTVVWTAECAEAFGLCQTVLSMGDEVGARMAFKEAYTRIVAQARAERRPAQWLTSTGWDASRRTAAISKAVRAGLLPAPASAGLLTGPDDAPPDAKARTQLAAIKQMLIDTQARKDAEQLAAAEQVHVETAAFKARTAQQVAEYLINEAQHASKIGAGAKTLNHYGEGKA